MHLFDKLRSRFCVGAFYIPLSRLYFGAALATARKEAGMVKKLTNHSNYAAKEVKQK